jgi:hypothetical protein
VTSSATLIWSGTVSALASISPAVALRDLSIVNIGTQTAFIGGSSVTAAALPLLPGQQVTIQGWLGTSNTTTRDVYAITSAGTATLVAGLASNAWVV